MFENKEILEDIIKQNKISHAYMLIGPNETDKILFAKEFAKTILCDRDEYCNTCKSCIQFDSSNNPDFTIIQPDGNSIKIEQIRDMIQKVYEKPIVSQRKVYIIEDADKMTKEASNCLLKTLEEPPEYITIMLLVFSESMLLNTIRSRCQKIVFKKTIENGDQNTEVFKELDNIFENNTSLLEFLEKSKIIYSNKDNIYDILEYMNIVFMEKLKQNMNNSNTDKYIECIKLIEQTKNKLRHNANFDMSIDNLLFGLKRRI